MLVLLGVFGASMLYGEGMITPAISVLAAVEGLQVETPFFEPYVVPIAVAILLLLFFFQQFGTHRVGGLFGPIMVSWFVTIGVVGIVWIVRAPAVLAALNPVHAIRFFAVHGVAGILVLGAVVLAVTGAEALYVDMGHFGKKPIRLAWFVLVFPALVLNYFGAGCIASRRQYRGTPAVLPPGAVVGLLPMVAIATAAAIIASQALISGAFSLTQQAVQLGYVPRLDIEHTSSSAMGQIYVPQVNWALMVATITHRHRVRVVNRAGRCLRHRGDDDDGDHDDSALRRRDRAMALAQARVFAMGALFLAVDLMFFGANLVKVLQGGWLPLLIGSCMFTIMTTWKTGAGSSRNG